MNKIILPIAALAIAAGCAYFYYHYNASNTGAMGIFDTPSHGATVSQDKSADAGDLGDFALDLSDLGQGVETKSDKPAEAKVADAPKDSEEKTTAVAAPLPEGQASLPPTDISKLPAFVELKSEVESLNKVVRNQGESINALNNKLAELTRKLEQAEAEPPQTVENAGVLAKLTPSERNYAMSLLPELPEKIQRGDYGLSPVRAHASLQTGGVSAVMEAFKILSAQGEKVYLAVGNPAPRNRPVWLELHSENGITLLAKNLPYEAYAGLHNRSELPALFQLPAYLITYDGDGNLTFFRACEALRLQNY